MNDLFFARSLMALSLVFHIVFAVIGMGMPVLMVIAEGRWLRSKNPVLLELTKRWARGTAILFAVGAASGTVLSFELGLLWPGFMRFAGGIIGMPFSLEGFAFFTEAIFLGLHLYGWKRISPAAHWCCGVVVAISGLASAAFVVTANAWMNAPTGFRLEAGVVTDVDTIAAMLGPASLQQVIHMAIAAYLAVGAAVAAVHAFFLRRDPGSAFHRTAFRIAIAMAAVCAPLQLLSGDALARLTSRLQPVKFAALEAHYETRTHAPILIGGIPDDDRREVRGAIPIPSGLSILVGRNPATEVRGLSEFPRDEWPNTMIVHLAFDTMITCGFALFGLSAWTGWLALRRRAPERSRAFLLACLVAGPLGFIAIEAGWIVTEVGRQPWIIQGIMRTSEAVTPVPGLAAPFIAFTILYLILSGVLVVAMRDQFLETRESVPPPVEDTHGR